MMWEYMTVVAPVRRSLFRGSVQAQALTDNLNKLGEEGWELVSHSPIWWSVWGGTRELVLVLKRPRIAE